MTTRGKLTEVQKRLLERLLCAPSRCLPTEAPTRKALSKKGFVIWRDGRVCITPAGRAALNEVRK